MYKKAPTVYMIPPATKRAIPAGGRSNKSLFIAKIIIHPMAIYISVDTTSCLPIQNIFITIPQIAIIHTIPNIIQPIEFLKIVSVKGV